MDFHGLFGYFYPGNFVFIDLVAAGTNALNGALLARKPTHYRGNYWTVVGILLLAIFGGIGGGVSRDILLGRIPSALENPSYLILCLVAGTIGILAAYNRGQQFRERPFQLLTAFSLPWYAAIGVQAGLDAHLPMLGAIFLGIIGPTAGRYLIDLTARVPAKQFIRGEWFVGTAVLTSIVFLICAHYLGLSIWPATLISVAFGFTFRVAAVWQGWEEPMPKVPPELIEGLPEREAFKQKRQERQQEVKQ